MSNADIIRRAREIYTDHTDDIEIDLNPDVAEGEHTGHWVRAWVFVPEEEEAPADPSEALSAWARNR